MSVVVFGNVGWGVVNVVATRFIRSVVSSDVLSHCPVGVQIWSRPSGMFLIGMRIPRIAGRSV
jgi:hypothetical protein